MTESSASDGFLPKMATMIVVAGAITVPMAYLSHVTDRPLAQHVPAEPYAWPLGCKEIVATDSVGHRFYRHEIPKACMDQEYYIADPAKYGLMGSRGIRNYYRVGPDAINIYCPNESRCVAYHIDYDVFSESGNSHE